MCWALGHNGALFAIKCETIRDKSIFLGYLETNSFKVLNVLLEHPLIMIKGNLVVSDERVDLKST
jgi:hypothetical protein